MKKNKVKQLILLIILCINFIKSYAQEDYIKIKGEYRVRTELRNGYRTLVTDSSKSAFFIGQRARLVFDFKKDKIKLYFSIQDARTWGDEEQRKDLSGLQVNELWSELGFKKGFSMKLGRQELVYDDHRLLGNLDWANLTISHDALLIKYANDSNKLKWHIGGAFNQIGEPLSGTKYTLKNYKVLGFTWVKKDFKNGHSITGIAIANGLNSTVLNSSKIKATCTFGPLYNYNLNGWKGTLGAYFQGGKTENNLSQSAFMINVYGEKKIKKIIFGLGSDFLSGNGSKMGDTKSHSFNTLYATNHKFYGIMDYFLNIPNDTKQSGLVDAYGRIGYEPNKKISAALDIHNFLLAAKSKLNPIEINKELGTELDFIMDYKPTPIIHLQIGYSVLFATKNMELIKGGNADNFNTWAYIMLKISPSILLKELKNN